MIGDVDGVVLVAAERRAQLFLHSDDGELDAFDAHDLSERRDSPGKQRGPHGVADHRHQGAAMVFLVVKKRPSTTPISRMPTMVGGDADDGSVLAGQVVALHVGGVLAVRAIEDAVADSGIPEARVVGADGLVALELVEVLAAAQATGGGDLRHHERFRPEGLGGALLGVDAEAVDGGAHHDHAGHADDHAQQRQKAAQFVRADGIHRQAECVLKLMPGAGRPGTGLGHAIFQDNVR